MDTKHDDIVYVTHYRDTVEMRTAVRHDHDCLVLTQEEARELAGQLLMAATIAEKWKE